MGKRFFAVAVLIVVCMGVFALPVYATEAVTETSTENIDALYRVKEFIAEYSEETSVFAGVLTTIVSVVVFFKKLKKKYDEGTDATTQSHGTVVTAVNKLIEEIEAVRIENAEAMGILKDFFAKATAVQLETSAILEIAERVYVNNKNLPQGVKDSITQIYAQCKIEEGGMAEEVSAIEARLIDTSAE